MEIDSLITRAVLTVRKEDTLRDAAVWMMERGVGSAVVLTDAMPTGILTDRDALRAIARGKQGDNLTVGDLLTGKLTQPCPVHRITARPRIGSMVHIGSGVWRAPQS